MKIRVSTMLTLTLLASCLCAPIAAASEPGPVPGGNIAITITLSRESGGRTVSEETYDLVAGSGDPVELHTGARIPIPTAVPTGGATSVENVANVVSYTYQNVGFEFSGRALILAGGDVLLEGNVQSSRVAPPEPGQSPVTQPVILSIDHAFRSLLLHPRSPLRIHRVADSAGGQLSLTISARVL